MVVKTKAVLTDKISLSKDTFHFKFSTRDIFEYLPGQFLNFVVSKENDQRPLRRAYSIANEPHHENLNYFELCIKIEEFGEFTPLLQQSKVGAEFDIMGPLGLFKLKNIDNSSTSTQVFVAAGTGIAPMRSFIRHLLLNLKYQSEVILLFGVRTSQDILFEEEFKQLCKTYSNFKFIITLSRPDDSWVGLRGYVQDHLHNLEIDLESSNFYMCGRTKMVDSVHEKLDLLGIAKENRSHEKFG